MIITLAIRVLQLIFAIIVLALSVVLIKDFGPVCAKGEKLYGPAHPIPSLISYGAFCGGAALVIAVVGVVAAFFDKLQGLIIMVLDGLAAFFLLAGGIAFAVKVPIGNCGDSIFVQKQKNSMFWPDASKCYPGDDDQIEHEVLDDQMSRCRMFQADTTFIWFTFACFLATTALSCMTKSRGGGRATMV